jgi:hypothetical protein
MSASMPVSSLTTRRGRHTLTLDYLNYMKKEVCLSLRRFFLPSFDSPASRVSPSTSSRSNLPTYPRMSFVGHHPPHCHGRTPTLPATSLRTTATSASSPITASHPSCNNPENPRAKNLNFLKLFPKPYLLSGYVRKTTLDALGVP